MAAILSRPQWVNCDIVVEYGCIHRMRLLRTHVMALKENHIHINTLRPRQNGCLFADDTFNRIFVNENVRIAIKFSLKFAPKGPINNIPALVQVMAWRRSGDKPYLNQWWPVQLRIYASLGLNELNGRIVHTNNSNSLLPWKAHVWLQSAYQCCEYKTFCSRGQQVNYTGNPYGCYWHIDGAW